MKFSRNTGGSTACLLLAIPTLAFAQSTTATSCSSLSPPYAAPSVASGYVARLVATGLTSPRDLLFDSNGALLAVEAGSGIVAMNVTNPNSTCPGLTSHKTVVNDTSLTHGIELFNNGSTHDLYASSADVVRRWVYSPSSQSNTSAPLVVVDNMAGADHVTRTLKFSSFAPGLLIVTRGSSSNLDYAAEDVTSGHSEVKAFNLTNATTGTAYNFDIDGVLLGWGLRNDVGVDEHPITGGVYTVENGADQITRDGVDIHAENPAEELNFLGYLANRTASTNFGSNFGYPTCFTAWDPALIPNFTQPVGTQFAIDSPNSTTVNDTACQPAAGIAAPRLAFHSHMAPLDILFNPSGTASWVTFHGSWDSSPPVGYKLSAVAFDAGLGAPLDPPDSTTAAIDIVSNANITACPDACFRPAGLAWDAQGRLWMSSDSTGEIYVITRSDGMAVWDAGQSGVPLVSGNGTGGGASNSSSNSVSGTVGAPMSGTATVVPPQGTGTGVVSATSTRASASASATGSGAERAAVRSVADWTAVFAWAVMCLLGMMVH